MGYQLPSCPCAQYSVLKRRGPIFPRTEAANTVSNGSHDDYYPLNFIGNVSITDHEGTFVGHVLANTNKILQVRQLESRRIHIRGLVNAITSGISNGSGSSQNIPDLTSSSGIVEERQRFSTSHETEFRDTTNWENFRVILTRINLLR